ncbi:hypothetical protein 4 [Wuhan spider virus 8]|uniref:hypothetical protein 4 n=1 Tax=Wuhan spider virus 8 TaxID=1923757 RepID=UPI00090A4673|nr:hypothetical protein 4 [Wuhan spider virus 8]APG76396.1 hypothetical protein 4 [Wuhan spider virus 8]
MMARNKKNVSCQTTAGQTSWTQRSAGGAGLSKSQRQRQRRKQRAAAGTVAIATAGAGAATVDPTTNAAAAFLASMGHQAGRYWRWLNNTHLGSTPAGRLFALFSVHPAAMFHYAKYPEHVPDDATANTYLSKFNMNMRVSATTGQYQGATYILVTGNPEMPLLFYTADNVWTRKWPGLIGQTPYRVVGGAYRWVCFGLTVYVHQTANEIPADLEICKLRVPTETILNPDNEVPFAQWWVPNHDDFANLDWDLQPPGKGLYAVSFNGGEHPQFAPRFEATRLRMIRPSSSGKRYQEFVFDDDTPQNLSLEDRDCFLLRISGNTPITLKVYGLLEIEPETNDTTAMGPITSKALSDPQALLFVTRAAQITRGVLPAAANSEDWLSRLGSSLGSSLAGLARPLLAPLDPLMQMLKL